MKFTNIFATLMIAMLSAGSLLAQNENIRDPKAKQVLDALSEKTNSYTSMYAEFENRLQNSDGGIDETTTGKVWIKGIKYKLAMAGQEIISDGETIWTFLVEEEEVQIDDAAYAEELGDGMTSPKDLFSMYEKGFKYQYMGEATIDGKVCHHIKLFPEKADKSYHTIHLYVDKAKTEIVRMKLMGKDGTDYTYTIKKFETNNAGSDAIYSFDESRALDVIDLR